VLASKSLGGVGYADGIGMADQALTQGLGVLAVVAWSAIATLALCWLCRVTVGLRARDETIEDGLDMASHGERAYNG
jgi:ammonium transporter, Amt family